MSRSSSIACRPLDSIVCNAARARSGLGERERLVELHLRPLRERAVLSSVWLTAVQVAWDHRF
jgi:hypothetical protein